MRSIHSMTRALVIGAVLFVAACGSDDEPASTGSQPNTAATGATTDAAVDPAPELVEIANWYNTNPLTLAQLRGSPVLLVFWSDT